MNRPYRRLSGRPDDGWKTGGTGSWFMAQRASIPLDVNAHGVNDFMSGDLLHEPAVPPTFQSAMRSRPLRGRGGGKGGGAGWRVAGGGWVVWRSGRWSMASSHKPTGDILAADLGLGFFRCGQHLELE